MKQKLLSILPVFFLFIGLNSIAQTDAIALQDGYSLPTTAEQGEGVPILYEYTIADDGNAKQLKISITEYGPDGTSYIGDLGAQYIPVDPTTELQTGNTTVTLPGDITLSSETDNIYKWTVAIQDQSTFGIYDQVADVELNVIAATSAVNEIKLQEGYTLPSTVVPGEVYDIMYEYTAADDSNENKQIKISITEYSEGGGYQGENGADQYFPIATVPVSEFEQVTYSFTVPAELANSSEIGTNYYRWSLIIQEGSGSYPTLASIPTTDVTVSENAGLANINADGIVVYPNPVVDQLFIDNQRLGASSLVIYDIAGRAVHKMVDLDQMASVDVASLTKGIYFLVTDTKQQLKFIKK